jgi:hypothetical protein
MPFDGTLYQPRIDAIGKIDQVIDLLSSETRWCKGRIYTDDGRRCLLGALKAANAQSALKGPVLAAIRQVTGRHFASIPRFNDDLSTTHATVLQVLHQTRANLEAGLHEPRPGLWARPWMHSLASSWRGLVGA